MNSITTRIARVTAASVLALGLGALAAGPAVADGSAATDGDSNARGIHAVEDGYGTDGIGRVGGIRAIEDGSPAGVASSPPPRVHIGQLSGPETGPEGAPQYWLEVTATDRDGIVNEITVEVTGGDYRSILFADRPCFLFPSMPGEAVTMRIPLSLPGPGSYGVRVHADSVPTCGSTETQTGPEKQRRFRVAG